MSEKQSWRCSRAGTYNGIATGGVDVQFKAGHVVEMKEDEATTANLAAEMDESKAEFMLVDKVLTHSLDTGRAKPAKHK